MSTETTTTSEELFGAAPKNLPPYRQAPSTRLTQFGQVELREVDLSKRRERRAFMEVPAEIYANDPHYMAPMDIQLMNTLDPAHNYAFQYLEVRAWQAFKHGRLVGRITAQVDHNMERHSAKRAGHFGFFESIDDAEVAHALLTEAMNWLEKKGCKDVLGPANFTLSHNSGLLVDNFDRPPFVEQLYNPPYYEKHLLSFGLDKAKDLLVWWIDLDDGMNNPKRKRIDRIAQKIQKKEGVSFRHANLKQLSQEIGVIHRIFTEAWEKNWGFAPVPPQEFEAISKEIKPIVVPELVLFVQAKGRDVGFSLTLPNVNEKLPKDGKLFPLGWTGLLNLKRTEWARLYLLGVLPEYRKRGLESLMFAETVRRALSVGMKGGEIGWTLEDNHLINRAIESMDGRLDRTYRIMGMTFET